MGQAQAAAAPPAAQRKEDVDDFLFQIVLAGDATVGKTHLLSQYITGLPPKKPGPTNFVEVATQTVGAVKVHFYDTAGQERFRSLTTSIFKRKVGALLVYDVTHKVTFDSCGRWMEELRRFAPNVVIMLVGNKADLASTNPSMREVRFDAAQEFAKHHGLIHAEASALTSHNVKYIFEHLLQAVLALHQPGTRSLQSSQDPRLLEQAQDIVTLPDRSAVMGATMDAMGAMDSMQARPAAFQASIDESQNSWGRLVAARVAGLEASHQAEVNELKRALSDAVNINREQENLHEQRYQNLQDRCTALEETVRRLERQGSQQLLGVQNPQFLLRTWQAVEELRRCIQALLGRIHNLELRAPLR